MTFFEIRKSSGSKLAIFWVLNSKIKLVFAHLLCSIQYSGGLISAILPFLPDFGEK